MLTQGFNPREWAADCLERATPALLKAFVDDMTTEFMAPRLTAYHRANEVVRQGRAEWNQRRHDPNFRHAQKQARQERRLAQNELRVIGRAVKIARLARQYKQLGRRIAPHALHMFLLHYAFRLPVERMFNLDLLPEYDRRLRFTQQCMTVEQAQVARLVLSRHSELFAPVPGLMSEKQEEQANRDQLYRKILHAVKLTANEARLLKELLSPAL